MFVSVPRREDKGFRTVVTVRLQSKALWEDIKVKISFRRKTLQSLRCLCCAVVVTVVFTPTNSDYYESQEKVWKESQ